MNGNKLGSDRFKLIGNVLNWEQTRFPSLLGGYNGTPALISKSGELDFLIDFRISLSGAWYSNWHDGSGYAELDCDTAQVSDLDFLIDFLIARAVVLPRAEGAPLFMEEHRSSCI